MKEKLYKINEIFYSLQGEGRWAGRAAVFVRFSGCNLHCLFCDTDFSTYREMSVKDIVDVIVSYPARFVVLTGGEPTLQADDQLVEALHERGCFVAMETNGTHLVTIPVDWVTISPKDAYVESAHVMEKFANEVKVVMDESHEPQDFGVKAKFYYVQPCDTGDEERNKEILSHAISFVKENPRWQLSLQQHKIINIR